MPAEADLQLGSIPVTGGGNPDLEPAIGPIPIAKNTPNKQLSVETVNVLGVCVEERGALFCQVGEMTRVDDYSKINISPKHWCTLEIVLAMSLTA